MFDEAKLQKFTCGAASLFDPFDVCTSTATPAAGSIKPAKPVDYTEISEDFDATDRRRSRAARRQRSPCRNCRRELRSAFAPAQSGPANDAFPAHINTMLSQRALVVCTRHKQAAKKWHGIADGFCRIWQSRASIIMYCHFEHEPRNRQAWPCVYFHRRDVAAITNQRTERFCLLHTTKNVAFEVWSRFVDSCQ